MKILLSLSGAAVVFLALTFTALSRDKTVTTGKEKSNAETAPGKAEHATFAGGCFWCVEAVFESLDGVHSVTSGYTGGNFADPTYEKICDPARKDDPGNHAEAVQIEFDPKKISYDKLLDLFWRMHDPTTINRQGADAGSQYRSAIYYHSDEQKAAAESSKKEAAPAFEVPIVTQIVKADRFYPAESHHQDYFARNPHAGYCSIVIAPKLRKLDLDK